MSFEDEYNEYAKNEKEFPAKKIDNSIGVNVDQGKMKKKPELSKRDQISRDFKNSKKPTIEETHTRVTFHLENELSERLNEEVKKAGRGSKHYFLNMAVKMMFESKEEKVE